MATETVVLNIGDIRIKFLAPTGGLRVPGSPELIRSHQFEIEGPGIDPLRVKSVELPKLDYGSTDPVTVKVEMYPTGPLSAETQVEDPEPQTIPNIDIPLEQVEVKANPAPFPAVLANADDLELACEKLKHLKDLTRHEVSFSKGARAQIDQLFEEIHKLIVVGD